MKRSLLAGIAGLTVVGTVNAEGLYYAGNEAKETLPLKWVVGANLTYDDNVNPTAVTTGDALSVNPYVGLSFVSSAPQTTWDVSARLGVIYYVDTPANSAVEDAYGQARIEANLTHRFNERLRLVSRNFVAYELEPDYAFGFANNRQVGEYFFWQTDNALGYRWTERLATYTGIQLTGLMYDSSVPNADRFTATVYNQFRYQLSPQTVLTADYRYAQTSGDGLASDATDHFILAGIEHRLSPTTILVGRGGIQIHQVDSVAASDGSSPYFELTMDTQINSAFKVRGFLRYGLENYDTVRAVSVANSFYEFDSRQTLRLGINADYSISRQLSVFGGIDYIPSQFEDGRRVSGPGPLTRGGLSEDLINAYVGVSVRFTDYLSGDLSYNYTDSSSDLFGATYDRNRVNVGIRAEF